MRQDIFLQRFLLKSSRKLRISEKNLRAETEFPRIMTTLLKKSKGLQIWAMNMSTETNLQIL